MAAETKLKAIIEAEDRASNTIKGISDKAASMGKAFLVAGGLITTALGFAVKAAADAQVQMARVDATLKTMGATGLKSKEAILEAAQATQKLGFDSEDSAESISKLFQRTGNLSTAIKLNNLAMDLSRAKNIDLATASKLVGQVLSGNGKVLKDYGIILSDTLTPMQALGQLQTQVGGQAAEAAKTFTVQLKALQLSLNDIAKAIGNVLLPILTNVVNTIRPVIDRIVEWIEANPKLTEQIVLWTAAIGGGLLVLGGLMVLLGTLFSPMNLIIGAVAAVAAGFFYLATQTNVLSKAVEFAKGVWANIKPTLDGIWNIIKAVGEIIWALLKPSIDAVIESTKGLWASMKELWAIVGPVLLPVLQFLAAFLGVAFVGAILVATVAIKAAIEIINFLINAIKWLIDRFVELGGVVKSVWDGIVSVVKTSVEGVMAFIEKMVSAWEKAKAIVSAPIKAASGAISGAVSGVKNFVGGVVDKIKGKADGGPVSGGTPYIVGERGPEWFVPNKSGMIIPNGAGAGGGVVVNILGGTYLSESVAEDIGNKIISQFRRTVRI